MQAPHRTPAHFNATTALVVIQLLAACGGSAELSQPGDTGGSSPGGNAAGGAATTTPTTVNGGSTTFTPITDGGASPAGGAWGSGGAVSNGGAVGLGGAVGVGGAIGTGAATAVGGTTAIYCSMVSCDIAACPSNSQFVVRPGECCPTCVPIAASCALVVCEANLVCPHGFEVRRNPGACCDTCYPTAAAQYPNCEAVDCAPQPSCPRGYRHSTKPYRCCNDCVPDPNYCETQDDCIIAQKPSGCCGCPEVISTRVYAEDSCYSALDTPRTIAASCFPDLQCTMVCGVCATMKSYYCGDNTCRFIDLR